jgi:hypothetical protein
MKHLFLFLILLTVNVFGSMTMLITDEQFLLPKVSNYAGVLSVVETICSSYPNNKLTRYHKKIIAGSSIHYTLHPVLLLSKMEAEHSLITECVNLCGFTYQHRLDICMGYGLSAFTKDSTGNNVYKYGGYYTQVTGSAYTLKYWFDRWKPGMKIKICVRYNTYEYIVPENAATFALYKYTPHYAEFLNDGHKNMGNAIFPAIYRKLNDNIGVIKMHIPGY